ncbi:MAG: tRNA (adenosine(37)-N6)-dimethylallyltransferase MiaA, partial [Dehalococcoidia bacterium]|nr:tRNA (adenosine(37)-N6)-dimethylallyltransferase MiaA [Dehalococcoidia bacterium]
GNAMMLRRLVAIVGPTASGKSAIAQELALRLGGEIVNGDSRQIYRGMDIGTAKPSVDDRRQVRHHLFDIAEPTETYSLALYKRDALAALECLWQRDTFAWLVGGTGQYIWALLEDWQVPEVAPDPGLRAELTDFAEREGYNALHARLEAVDPVAAERIDARNVRRVVRAIEVYEHTGVPISTWQERRQPDFEYLLFGVDVPKEVLDERIDRRVEEMFAAGFVDEVRALLDSGVPADAPAMSSIGYAEIAQHLRGELTLEQAKEDTKRATRRLARRQMQWFRRDDRRITWVRDADDIEMQANIFTGACTNTIRGARR